MNPQVPEKEKEQVEVEVAAAEMNLERHLETETARTVSNLFPGADEDRDPYDFKREVEAKGVTVTLAIPDGPTITVPGEHFANGVWEAIANA